VSKCYISLLSFRTACPHAAGLWTLEEDPPARASEEKAYFHFGTRHHHSVVCLCVPQYFYRTFVTKSTSEMSLILASRVAQRSKAVLEVSLQIRVRSRAVSQPAATRRPMRRRTIFPVSFGLGEDLAGRDVLVPSLSSDSCGGPGAYTLTRSPVGRSFLRHIGVAGFQVKRAVYQEEVWLGRVAWLSTFASPESVRELQRWDMTVTTNWISQNWREKGVKEIQIK
jgi:hypothetical protein